MLPQQPEGWGRPATDECFIVVVTGTVRVADAHAGNRDNGVYWWGPASSRSRPCSIVSEPPTDIGTAVSSSDCCHFAESRNPSNGVGGGGGAGAAHDEGWPGGPGGRVEPEGSSESARRGPTHRRGGCAKDKRAVVWPGLKRLSAVEVAHRPRVRWHDHITGLCEINARAAVGFGSKRSKRRGSGGGSGGMIRPVQSHAQRGPSQS